MAVTLVTACFQPLKAPARAKPHMYQHQDFVARAVLELRAGENLRKTSRWAAKGVTRGRRLKPPEPELNTR